MGFDEHQLRLWTSMIKFVDDYIKDKIGFSQLVSSLEGVFMAGEFKNQDLVNDWYSVWTPLEIYKAVKMDTQEPMRKVDVIKDIEAMRAFLVKKIKRSE